ncbi:DUF4157 domain-containing protein [Ramlibacter sp. G-1-2-2]|uniref:DUF4157 domain-containing protein n=1 Tax=Ramlibacter agri TaxID=2728837 RepID=A0A848H8P1_9BURK|nr:DUF4157 domain-containing protein [Ramlibacter agri]NML46847.1 DUF4157 domain-containing protein [Ramlibacter agri]
MSQRALAPAKPAPVLRPVPVAVRQQAQEAALQAEERESAANAPFPHGGLPFTALDPRPPGRNIADADLARMLVTRLLLDELAPRLGLDPARIRIEVNAGAEARVNAAGASGLQEGATIYLHPARFRPQDPQGRYLLAHEAVHAAQRGLGGAVRVEEAEREAAELGQAFAQKRALRRPQQPLGLAPAADSGEEAPPVTVDDSIQLVSTSVVAESRSREISEIRKSLAGLWISDGDVFDVLRILDSVPFAVASAIVRSLDEGDRYGLADNINPPHVYQNRRSVLVCYYHTLDDNRLQDAVDLKVFRALPISGMSTEETEAAAWTLRHLQDKQRQELLESDNGPAIKRIISAPQPSAEELRRIQKDATEAAASEAALAEKRRAILAHKTDPAANTLLQQVRSLLAPPSSDNSDQQPAGQLAIQALDLLDGARGNESLFLYVAEQMELETLVDQLLDLLPADSYFDKPSHSATLIALVRSRLPYKNEKLVESLLSYGLFDWAIRDYEALFAYKLLKLMPLAQQYKFRLRDSGKWYLRLLENLPDDQRYPGLEIRVAESQRELDEMKAKYQALKPDDAGGLGVEEVKENGETRLFFNASQLYEAKLEKDPGAKTTLAALLTDFKENKKEATELYKELVLLGGSSLEKGKETPGDELLRASIIHELDGLGYIDRLFGDLKDSFLFAEENRISTVKIMLARDPARAQAHARELVSRSFTDWMVTDKEAYLAYLCVKALPADEREAFVRDNATEWERIQGEMSESMRQSRDLNLYIGDKAGTDRGSVLGQLAESATWTEPNAALLGDLVRMAIAMTEHRFAFERSQEFKAIEKPKLQPLVEKYRLWDPQKRPEYKADILQGTRWYEEGIFSDLRTLWSGLVTLWNLDVLFIENKIGLKVDLNDVQSFKGGDLGGARLGDPKKQGASATPPGPDANKLTLLVGTDMKSAELILPELLIDSANVQLASTTLQSGAINLKGLHIHAAYDQEDLGQPTQAHVSLQSVEANDVLIAKSNSMITVTRLAVSMLRLAAGTIDTVTGGTKERQGRSVPFPLLVVPLLAMFVLLALPIYLYKKIAGWVSEGLESNPAEKFAGDVATRTKAIDFSFDSLDVDSITTSGGQHVGHVGVRDFAVRLGLNKATRLRAELASIAQRLKALEGQPQAGEAVAKLKARQAVLVGQQQQVEKDEQEYLQIQQQILAGGLSAEQQASLQKRLNALDFEDKGGAFIDIGSVDASDVRGTVTSEEPIHLSGIHGEGGSAVLTQMVALPTATAAELSRRSGAGERPAAPLSGQDGTVSLEIDTVHTGRISFGGGLQTVEDIDQKIKDLEPLKAKEEVAPLLDSLHTLRGLAERYELMLRHGVSALSGPQLEEFRVLREQLRAKASLVAQSIDLTHAKIDVDVATGRIGVGAEAVRLAGVQLPDKGIDIDEVVARGLGVGALPAGGLLKWGEWKKNLQDADGKVDELTVSGVRSKYHGLLFEKATLTGAYARMKDRGDVLEAGLKKLTVEGLGVAPRIGLLNQRLAGLQEKAKLADDKQKPVIEAEVTKLAGKIAELQALQDARVAAYRRLEAAKTPEDIEAAKDAVAESDTAIALGLAQYGASSAELDDFGVKVTGAGDVVTDMLGSGLDVDRILKRGVRVQGTGPDNRVLRRLKVSGANAKDDQADSSYVGKGDFELGETKLNLHAQRVGDSAFIDLDQFGIASLTLAQMLFTTDEAGVGFQVGSTGKSSIEDVSLSGKVRLDKKPKVEGEGKFPQDFRFAHAEITDLHVGAIRADGLSYASIPDQIEVRIKSGSVEGVWAQGVSIDFPEDGGKTSILGSAGIDKISDVDMSAALADGMVRHADGRISGKKLQLDFLKEGELQATIGDLNANAFSLRGPDGWARFDLNHLSGKIGIKGGNYALKDVHLGSLSVKGIDWAVGEKGRVKADKPATLANLRVTADIATEQVPDKDAKPAADGTPAKKTQLQKVKVKDFHIDTIQAEHLIYQDDKVKVEIKPFDPATDAATMKDFRPLYLQDFSIKDLDWSRGGGLTAGDIDVKKFDAAVHFERFKDGLKAGFALKGVDMGTSFVGPDMRVMSLGVIEKTGGYLKDKSLDTTFGTGQVVGAVTFGKDYIELTGLQVDAAYLGKTTYTSDDGKSLVLDSANVEKITLDKVHANFETVKDEDGKDTQQLKDLSLENLEFTGIKAGSFDYHGKAKAVNDKGEEGEVTQGIRGWGATIGRFQVSKLTHDQKSRLTKLSFELTARDKDKSKQAFTATGLSGDIIKTFGKKTTVTSFATDVDGDAIYGDDIQLKTVSLGKVKKADGSYAPVERTAIDGKFILNRIGLINPNLTLTDEDGNTTKVSTYYDGGSFGRIDIKNIQPQLLPNGAAVVPIQSILAQQLKITRGGTAVYIPLAELQDFSMGLKGMGTDKGVELIVARAKKLLLGKGLEVVISVDRTEKSKAVSAHDPGPKFMAGDPLGKMSGQFDIEYENTGPNAWLHLPVSGGVLNFENVHPFAVNLEQGDKPEEAKLTLGNYGSLYDIVTVPKTGGMHPELGKYGKIDFQEMLETMLTDTGAAKDAKSGPPGDLSKLNNLTAGGHLTLGEGRMGYDLDGDGKLGEGDNYIELSAADSKDNTVDIPSQVVGKELAVNIPRVHAKGAGFKVGEQTGKTGEINFNDIRITVTGLAKFEFVVRVKVKSGEVDDIEFGDVTFLDAGKLNTADAVDRAKVKALPDPTLKQVNPKGEEGAP